MNLSTFDYFIVLAQERNFTRAAHQLHITQQSLSSQISLLEKELGATLVVRHVPLELTYAGEVFLKHAKTVQHAVENMQRELCDITETQKGVLRIGISFVRSRSIMPGLIQRFQKEYPNIEIKICELSNKLYFSLLNGDVDLAIGNFTANMPEVEIHDFYHEEVVLMISKALMKELGLSNNTKLKQSLSNGDLSLLKNCPFVLGNLDSTSSRIGRSLIKQANFIPIVKATSNSAATLLALCRQNIGACFGQLNLAQAILSKEDQKISCFSL
jgi:DNA-binding transcriptional LysR family regulator